MTSGPRAQPVPAATVVLLRPGGGGGPETLLIHRPASMAFGPGLHAFPGGRVDREDVETARRAAADEAAEAAASLGGNASPVDAVALRLAAVREVAEEVGVVVLPGALRPIARWTTPPFMPRRFATWFFVADLPAEAEPIFAADEVAAHRWRTPRAALDEMRRGEIEMWVPTTSVLRRLVEIDARCAADVAERLTLGRIRAPRVSAEPRCATVESDNAGGLPGRLARTTVLGHRELVVIDPGDPDEPAIDAILAIAADRDAAFQAIVLTAADPDHAAGAEALAIPLGLPILAAPGAGRELPHAIRDVTDGERLPTDVPARVRIADAANGRLVVERG